MASRPLPPGRRGRGGRAVSAQHLPEVKILNVEQAPSTTTTASSYVEQLRVASSNDKATAEPEHESNAQEEAESVPVRSVKAFVATLEKAEEPSVVASTPSPFAAEEAKPVAVATPQVVARSAVESPPAVEYKPAAVEPAIQTQHSAPTVIEPPVFAPAYQSAPVLQAREVHAPPTAAPVVAAPVVVNAASPLVGTPVVEGFHPFHLLLPVYSVPVVPEQVECVYDDDAVEMQKNIMKAIKMCLGKDRVKLEDFKINSRLYGNNFMDALEYLESLAKDLGGNRALQLVPCLLSIQPDFMKRNSMLVAARKYRMRNLAKLEAALDKEVAAVPEPVQPVAQSATSVVSTEVATPAVVAPVVTAAVEAVVVPIVSSPFNPPVVEQHIYESVAVEAEAADPVEEPAQSEADKVAEAPSPAEIDEPSIEEPTICEAEAPADLYVPPVEELVSEPAAAVEVVVEPATVAPAVVVKPEVLPTLEVSVVDATLVQSWQQTAVKSTVVEPPQEALLEAAEIQVPTVKDEPKAAAALTPVTIDVSPIELGTSQTSFVSAQAVTSPTPSDSSSTSSAEADGLSLFQEVTKPTPLRKQSTINLFGEDIGDDDDDDEDEDDVQDHIKITTPISTSTTVSTATPIPGSPSSSASSFFEAESLFGEVIPVKVTAPPAPHASVPSVVAPTPLPPPAAIRPQHSGMLFGFGTAGDDSDSDSDSDFSD